ncbi:methionyl-tRNA synthetase [Ceratobasidium sp. 423]|nr:methionyl-tRNA synthetase [Ceratobasidium sp. 423]
MHYSTLVLALFSASLSAAAPSHERTRSPKEHHIKRDDGHSLQLLIKPQDDLKNPDDLTVVATVINTGPKAVKILNDPNGPLSSWKTHTFNFIPLPSVGPDGVKSKTTGIPADVDAILVKYNPTTAAALNDPSTYTALQPGENKTVIHDLSGMYNFHAPGGYAVKLTSPAEYFNVIEDDGSISRVPASLTTSEAEDAPVLNIPVDAPLTSKNGLINTGIASIDAVALSFPNNRMIRRASDPKFTNCSAEQQASIVEAVKGANEYVENANNYFNGTLGERYTTWFGALADNRTDIVKGHFANLTDKVDQFQFDCSCDKADTFAYVYPTRFPTVYLCGAFWKAPVNGTDSKSGTIVHEGTHFVNIGSTQDYAYGQSGAKSLASSNPDRAIMNADKTGLSRWGRVSTPHCLSKTSLRYASTSGLASSTQVSATTGWSLKPYFVTTPIFYPNADPHIGHLYSMVIADILARYSRLRHPLRKVVFSTGTDEHGLKIQQAARNKGLSPEELCDRLSSRFKVLASNSDITYTRFIRTTDEDHELAVKRFWKQLVERGHIYQGKHSGWYSVSDECFYPKSQVEEVTDSNTAIRPEPYYRAVLDSLINDETATQDLSVSRPSFRLPWGIRVPGDQKHSIYVWLDALVNYLTVAGYPDNTIAWPADVSVIGKDILRFHAIFWPAFLLALDIPPPKTLLTHGHWTKDRQKMSKSRGNVANPFLAMGYNEDGTPKQRVVVRPEKNRGELDIGVDGVRWYMLRAGGTFETDSDWSHNQALKHYQRELSGSLGNLLSRVTAPKLVARLPEVDKTLKPASIVQDIHPEDARLNQLLDQLPSLAEGYMGQLQIGRVPEAIVECLNEANRHITQLEPWLPTSSTDVVVRAHKYSVETLRIVGILLQPFIPTKADQLLTQLGVSYEDRGWKDVALWKGDPTIGRTSRVTEWLFPRLRNTV